MVDYTDLVTKQHLIAQDTKNFYSNGVESIEHISWRDANCMQVLEDVQESEASLPSPSKRSPQVNKVGGGLSQIQLPTSWEIYYMQLKKHILIMCRCPGIPRWSNCSSELALPPPASKPRPTCPRFRLMVASKCWERNITWLDSGSVPQPVQLEHGGGWGTA